MLLKIKDHFEKSISLKCKATAQNHKNLKAKRQRYTGILVGICLPRNEFLIVGSLTRNHLQNSDRVM